MPACPILKTNEEILNQAILKHIRWVLRTNKTEQDIHKLIRKVNNMQELDNLQKTFITKVYKLVLDYKYY